MSRHLFFRGQHYTPPERQRGPKRQHQPEFLLQKKNMHSLIAYKWVKFVSEQVYFKWGHHILAVSGQRYRHHEQQSNFKVRHHIHPGACEGTVIESQSSFFKRRHYVHTDSRQTGQNYGSKILVKDQNNIHTISTRTVQSEPAVPYQSNTSLTP